MHNFEDLHVWQAARLLKKSLSKLAMTFPEIEKYRLSDQLIRSSRSVTANISEGFGRFHYQENIQFCRQARGSLCETLDHVITALDEGYISSELYESIKEHYNECLKLLNGYIAYLKKAKDSI